jgi:hypothetical protein
MRGDGLRRDDAMGWDGTGWWDGTGGDVRLFSHKAFKRLTRRLSTPLHFTPLRCTNVALHVTPHTLSTLSLHHSVTPLHFVALTLHYM